ncbi:MAG: hypothetical protein JXA49_05915 [Actinobacteria bacterium]|nr:hypothetical protein [Actinomycetota bacterium]
MAASRKFKCYDCGHEFEVPYGTGGMGRDMNCPECNSANIHRGDGDRGYERSGAGLGGARGRGPSPEGRGRGGAGRGPRRA